MKKLLGCAITIALVVSSAFIFTSCGDEKQEVELMGISKYSRTQMGELIEYDVSNHQVNENGQITSFDLHRTNIETVEKSSITIDHVDSDDSTVLLKRDEDGNIISAKTVVPDLGYQMYEYTYDDDLIDTMTYSTDWGGTDKYTIKSTYEKDGGNVTSMDAECIKGTGFANPEVYGYNDNGDVNKVSIAPESDTNAYVEIEYNKDGYVTKITNFNANGAFMTREFEYTSLGKTVTAKTGFKKWQENSIIDDALQNCN